MSSIGLKLCGWFASLNRSLLIGFHLLLLLSKVQPIGLSSFFLFFNLHFYHMCVFWYGLPILNQVIGCILAIELRLGLLLLLSSQCLLFQQPIVDSLFNLIHQLLTQFVLVFFRELVDIVVGGLLLKQLKSLRFDRV